MPPWEGDIVPPDDSVSPREVAGVVERAILASPAYDHLDDLPRRELAASLAAVTNYLRGDGSGNGHGGRAASARQLAPDLGSLRRSGSSSAAPSPSASPPAVDTTAAGAAGGGPVGRVGEVARATLNAIDFPTFVGSLIQGTFQAIVDSSIQQMMAYAEMLKQVATTVDQFMTDNVSDGMARDYLADNYSDVLSRDTSGGAPKLTVNDAASGDELPSFFSDLGFSSPDDLTDDTVEDVVVPAARRSLAEQRQQTLATMVLMGINRVVVNDGEITAKLVFHIDASETTEIRFDQTKTTVGTMARTSGTSPFTATGVLVNTTNVNAQSDINVRTDLTGQVTVRFRSETFPLERFADSYAIQLINSNASVPPPAAPPAGAAPAESAPPAPAVTPPPPAAAPAPATGQSLDVQGDPWAPGA
jgi:hypothetical protein